MHWQFIHSAGLPALIRWSKHRTRDSSYIHLKSNSHEPPRLQDDQSAQGASHGRPGAAMISMLPPVTDADAGETQDPALILLLNELATSFELMPVAERSEMQQGVADVLHKLHLPTTSGSCARAAEIKGETCCAALLVPGGSTCGPHLSQTLAK